jgi:hypothetical protein
MTKDRYQRIAAQQAEHAYHIYNVDSMKHAIRDYRRSTAKDKQKKIEEAEQSLRESQAWLRNPWARA